MIQHLFPVRRSRKSEHADYIYNSLVEIDTECRDLRFKLNENNGHYVMQKMINRTQLQKKYLRRLTVLNTIKDSEIQYLKQRVIALESELKKAHKNNSRHMSDKDIVVMLLEEVELDHMREIWVEELMNALHRDYVLTIE